MIHQPFLRTDDPIRDWDRYCDIEEKELNTLPICSICGQRIVDEFYYHLYDKLICRHCVEECYKEVEQ